MKAKKGDGEGELGCEGGGDGRLGGKEGEGIAFEGGGERGRKDEEGEEGEEGEERDGKDGERTFKRAKRSGVRNGPSIHIGSRLVRDYFQ